ncbi:MAG: hypothetical protein RSD70_06995 [Acidaminococcaceae bacterium]
MNIIRMLILTLLQVALDTKAILVSVADDNEYIDNKATGKKLGTKYTVVCPKNKYFSFTIKVAENTPIITQEEIDNTDEPIWVTAEGFEGKLYRLRGDTDYSLTARAEKVVLLSKEKGKGGTI